MRQSHERSFIIIFFFQLQNYCKTTLPMPPSSSMNQRLENLKSSFLQRKSSSYYHQLIENSKRCIVGLETTYRDALELNTTYLVGKTLEGETMLLPKQLMEQANVITINENNLLEDEQIENHHHHPNVSDDEGDDDDDQQQITVTDIIKTPYVSLGNVVRCVTGSFD